MPDGPSLDDVALDPASIVIRFSPTDPETVLRRATTAFLSTGRYGLSVFADSQRVDESTRDTKLRLLTVASLSHINPATNRAFFVCSRAQHLVDCAFSFYKDGYEGEMREHYSVDIGPSPTLDDVERFLAAFTDRERWEQ